MLLSVAATAVKFVSKLPFSKEIKSTDAANISTYSTRYTLTERRTSLPTFFSSRRITCILFGCTKEEISFLKFFHEIIILDTLIPPPVLPAQAPINISITNIDLDNEGHILKSTVENPVVVIIEPTWKNACWKAVQIDENESLILNPITTVDIKIIPK